MRADTLGNMKVLDMARGIGLEFALEKPSAAHGEDRR
jgi:hypothetical protein